MVIVLKKCRFEFEGCLCGKFEIFEKRAVNGSGVGDFIQRLQQGSEQKKVEVFILSVRFDCPAYCIDPRGVFTAEIVSAAAAFQTVVLVDKPLFTGQGVEVFENGFIV